MLPTLGVPPKRVLPIMSDCHANIFSCHRMVKNCVIASPGNEAMIPLARALMGGMIASTILTLVLVPCVYSLVHRKSPVTAA